MSSHEFRTSLVTDPHEALKAVGIAPTKEMVDALRAVDWPSIMRVARALDHYHIDIT